MNILIIGNGFDLAHGLKTGYGNFLDVIKTYGSSKIKIEDADNTEPQHFCFLNIKKVRKVYQSDIFRYMRSRYAVNRGWIDFENELREIVDEVCEFPECLVENRYPQGSNSKITYRLANDWDKKVSTFMFFYIERRIKPDIQNDKEIIIYDITKDVFRQIEDFIELFRKYICWINAEQVPEVAEIELFKSLHIDKLLTFNYTYTAEYIYEGYWRLNDDICYVHGAVDDNPNNHIVMGIGTDFYDAFKHSEYLPFFKFYQYYKFKTDESYLKWIDEIRNGFFYSNSGCCDEHNNANKCNIYIYGHSLDPTDKNILLPFLDVKSRTPVKIIIYYYRDSNLKNMEKNLVKILGVEKFSEYLCGDNPKIQFRRNR